MTMMSPYTFAAQNNTPAYRSVVPLHQRPAFAGESLLYQSLHPSSSPSGMSQGAGSGVPSGSNTMPSPVYQDAPWIQDTHTPILPASIPSKLQDTSVAVHAMSPAVDIFTKTPSPTVLNDAVYTGQANMASPASSPLRPMSFQSLPEGYTPILVPTHVLPSLVTALHNQGKGDKATSSFQPEEEGLKEERTKGSSSDLTTSEEGMEEVEETSSGLKKDKTSRHSLKSTHVSGDAYDEDVSTHSSRPAHSRSHLKDKLLQRSANHESPVRVLRRWVGYGLLAALTVSSALTGLSFGWFNQRFLVPKALQKLPIRRAISTLNGGVLAGGLMFYIGDMLRKGLGLAPSKKRPLYLDDLLY